MNNIKVLFINPNPRNMSLIPPVASLFYSIFKENNIDMKFFDTTFYDLSSHYTNTDESILEMPNFSKEEIIAKSLVFNFYIKFPKSRWRNIKRAEAITSEGAKIRSKLREEYLAKYCDENY